MKIINYKIIDELKRIKMVWSSDDPDEPFTHILWKIIYALRSSSPSRSCYTTGQTYRCTYGTRRLSQIPYVCETLHCYASDIRLPQSGMWYRHTDSIIPHSSVLSPTPNKGSVRTHAYDKYGQYRWRAHRNESKPLFPWTGSHTHNREWSLHLQVQEMDRLAVSALFCLQILLQTEPYIHRWWQSVKHSMNKYRTIWQHHLLLLFESKLYSLNLIHNKKVLCFYIRHAIIAGLCFLRDGSGTDESCQRRRC